MSTALFFVTSTRTFVEGKKHSELLIEDENVTRIIFSPANDGIELIAILNNSIDPYVIIATNGFIAGDCSKS